ncbi:MAG: endonuclease/exonuclease/phosphatase family protein [Gammaproteobacteria bacterium]
MQQCATAEKKKPASAGQTIKLLSYNIQAGIKTENYHHYLTRSWKHIVHHPQRFANLRRIADMLAEFDIVGIQEADAGSLRSGYINLTEYLAEHADFPYWDDKTNRRIGQFAHHSLGILSRFRPTGITEHKLPGRIPGRGALAVRYGDGEESLVVLIAHLALSHRARMNQLDYLADQINQYRHVVLMGDFNCQSESEEIGQLVNRTLMSEPLHGLNTFPSWRPKRNIDHILVSPTVKILNAEVMDCSISDHLPIAVDIQLPNTVILKN